MQLAGPSLAHLDFKKLITRPCGSLRSPRAAERRRCASAARWSKTAIGSGRATNTATHMQRCMQTQMNFMRNRSSASINGPASSNSGSSSRSVPHAEGLSVPHRASCVAAAAGAAGATAYHAASGLTAAELPKPARAAVTAAAASTSPGAAGGAISSAGSIAADLAWRPQLSLSSELGCICLAAAACTVLYVLAPHPASFSLKYAAAMGLLFGLLVVLARQVRACIEMGACGVRTDRCVRACIIKTRACGSA